MSTPGIRKLYYSIREVSERVGQKPHVLRYWETEFDQLRPKKNRAGNRAYTEHDIETLLEIQRLLKDEKYTIEGARQRLAAGGGGGLSHDTLRELRAFLSDVLQRL